MILINISEFEYELIFINQIFFFSANFEPRVKVVLYDTSSEQDINLNLLIQDAICAKTPEPQLNSNVLTHVNITYVMDTGVIWAQVKDAGIKYIEKLIYNLSKSKINDDIHIGLYNDKSIGNKYYLHFDEDSNKSYRVTINRYIEQTDEYELFFVDYGFMKTVKNKRMLRLDSLSSALHRFPRQAISFRLLGLSVTGNLVARLRGLLKPGTSAIVSFFRLFFCRFIRRWVIIFVLFPDKNDAEIRFICVSLHANGEKWCFVERERCASR